MTPIDRIAFLLLQALNDNDEPPPRPALAKRKPVATTDVELPAEPANDPDTKKKTA